MVKAVQDGVQHFEIDRHTCLAMASSNFKSGASVALFMPDVAIQGGN